MLQSSLKAPSQIDHELFPLLTVRSCVSEADESKNGPRFCAEDKLSGAAYEVRSRKLELEPASPKNSEAAEESAPEQQQRISAVNLQRIRRQQARMDALLSATASGAAPPSVSLPIDIYIQEQPSTGDTYVASVSAFAGLSLGDIIRSGWGVMEEQVFLEILNAVESYGYASASLPPHGNLSCDAIKQLLIVRDGASEERQPSRWVVGDWLLLGDDAACVYDAEAFTADLEWMLQSSFAQLRISTSPAGAYLSPGQVEDVVNETVERIRAVLTRQAAEMAASAHEGGAAAGAGAREGVEGSGDAAEGAGGVPAEQRVTATNSGKTDDAGALPKATGDVSTELPSPAAQEHVDPAASSLSNDELLMGRGPRNGTRQSGESPRELPPPEHAAATDGTRNMTLKDKMAYHQAALRNEQMLVNKQRRKNAPLPPRPTPTAGASGHTASSGRRSTFTPSFLAADGGGGYRGVPPLTMPIDVKPSAYLTQGQKPAGQSSTKGGTGAARRQPSPHSSRAHAADAHTPRENSRSSAAGAAAAAASAGQPSAATPKAAVVSPRDLQRERLLDDVVNMAVMKQRRRGQHYRIQQEVDRRRREQRQQVLAQNLSPRTLVPMHPYQQQQQHTMPAVLERPRVVRSSSAGSGAVGGTARQGKMQQQQQAGAGRRGSAPTAASTATLAPPPPMTAIPAGTSPPQAPGTAAAAYVVPADDWPATMSESPEPTPPSPNARRIVHTYPPPPAAAPLTAAALQTKRTPPATPRAKVLEALKSSSGGVARRGGARPAAAAAAAAGPVTRVKSGVGASRPVPGVRRVPAAATSGTGTPGARPAAARTVGAAGMRAPPTHPLSARDKAGQATLRPPPTDVQPAAGPTEPSAASHLPMLQGVQGRPFVKPLPLAALQQRRDTGSPLGPASTGGASSPAALHGDAPTAPDGAAAATAETLKTSAASGSVPSAAHPAHPAAGGSPRVLPLAPYTARPVPPQPVFSPRGYRRISSTGVVMQSRNDTAAKLRSAAPRVPPAYGSNLLQTPRSGRRKSAAGLDGPVATNSGRRATASGKAVLFDPEQRMRQAADPRGERAFAAVNRKPMQRLVPEKVRVTHSNTAHLQRTPRTAPAAPSPTVTPRGLVVASPKAGAAEKRSGTAGAPRRRSPLTLGSVRPVNETSRGILLRHPQRAAKKVV